MSSRAGLRLFQLSRATKTPFRKTLGRRYQAVDAAPTPHTQSMFQRLWNSPVGVKTVHFWAPVMKWSIVLAGVSDFSRPAENLSLTQNVALTCTGAIWTRWCFIIKPQNILLATVNFFLGCVGITQVTRILLYQRSLKGTTAAQEVKLDVKDATDTVKGIAENPQAAAKNAVN